MYTSLPINHFKPQVIMMIHTWLNTCSLEYFFKFLDL